MYTRKAVSKLTGDELFTNTGNAHFSVLNFWQYAFSNLNSNVLRGALAEFLVEAALKRVDDIGIRNPWGDYDVIHNRKTIEVKCCSYLQDWDQLKLSNILWSGLKAKSIYWNDAVAKQDRDETPEYKAEYYVLALLDHKETATLNILDLNQWKFFVLTQDKLRELTNNGKSVSLRKLEKNGVSSYTFTELPKAVMV